MPRSLLAVVLVLLLAVGLRGAAQQLEPQQPRTVFRANTALVSVDVVVRDASGAVVRGLTMADFDVQEDGKSQQIRSFAFEEVGDRPGAIQAVALLGDAGSKLASESSRASGAPPSSRRLPSL